MVEVGEYVFTALVFVAASKQKLESALISGILMPSMWKHRPFCSFA
jgi:hypothetical protein